MQRATRQWGKGKKKKKKGAAAAFNAIYFRNKNAFLLQTHHSRAKTSARNANEFMWHSLCAEVYICIYICICKYKIIYIYVCRYKYIVYNIFNTL